MCKDSHWIWHPRLPYMAIFQWQISIFCGKRGQTSPNRDKQSQMGPIRTRQGQTAPNEAKRGKTWEKVQNRASLDQMGPNRANWGLPEPSGTNWALLWLSYESPYMMDKKSHIQYTLGHYPYLISLIPFPLSLIPWSHIPFRVFHYPLSIVPHPLPLIPWHQMDKLEKNLSNIQPWVFHRFALQLKNVGPQKEKGPN